jgi:hypothetical protein
VLRRGKPRGLFRESRRRQVMPPLPRCRGIDTKGPVKRKKRALPRKFMPSGPSREPCQGVAAAAAGALCRHDRTRPPPDPSPTRANPNLDGDSRATRRIAPCRCASSASKATGCSSRARRCRIPMSAARSCASWSSGNARRRRVPSPRDRRRRSTRLIRDAAESEPRVDRRRKAWIGQLQAASSTAPGERKHKLLANRHRAFSRHVVPINVGEPRCGFDSSTVVLVGALSIHDVRRGNRPGAAIKGCRIAADIAPAPRA